MKTRNEWIDFLSERIVNVTFTKINGDKREMLCTLKRDLLPPVEVKEEPKTPRKINESVVNVYDLEKKGFRSFKIDSVVTYEVADES